MRLAIILLAASLVACRDKAESNHTAIADSDGDGYAIADGDCDDADAETYPGASELCDEIDNDCNGTIDEDAAETFYADADGDSYGDPEDSIEACEAPSGYTDVGDDCDDSDAETYPSAAERCDEIDNDCDGTVDEDVQSTWYADADEDGFGDPDAPLDDCDPPSRYVSDDTDCDDLDAEASPDGTEVCDGADNDCDGTVDENVTTTWYIDYDGDRYGVDTETVEACTQPTGYALYSGDCDDNEADVSPSATEMCDSIDNDCDTIIDEDDAADADTFYSDSDSDGYGDSSVTTTACTQPSGFADNSDDCDDTEPAANPGESEVCDGIDNDCDGDTDEQSATDAETWYADSDGDGYGSSSSTVACTQPSGFADNSDDCDDGEEDANPGETEVCDSIDNDCDGDTDEGLTSTYYIDYDGDGYGSTNYTAEACSQPTGYVSDDTDCDDTEELANPGETEICGDGIDNDCDSTVDNSETGTEDCPATDCDQILTDGSTDDGVYWVDPTGSDPYEVYCDQTSEGGGWTLLAVFTNNDSVSWGYDSAAWVTAGDFGAPTSPSTNADAKSQAFDDMPVDELMIVGYPSSLSVLTETSCIDDVPLLEIFQVDSNNSSNCAYSCDTDTVNAPWSGQSRQDDKLRMRCMDNDGDTTANGYTVSTDDNSMLTTLKNDGTGEDYNFGLGAGLGGSTIDWDESTDDSLDDDDTTQILLLGR